jgi:uncharacterized protein (TIGR02271 family)
MSAAREPTEPMRPSNDSDSMRTPLPTPIDQSSRLDSDIRQTSAGEDQRLELHEEVLVARKRLVDAGEVVFRTEVDEVPGRLDVEALREDVKVTREPVGKAVTERTAPWEEGDELVIPIYEEQLVVTKRLFLREHIRVQRLKTTEVRHFEDTVRRERLVIDDSSPRTDPSR